MQLLVDGLVAVVQRGPSNAVLSERRRTEAERSRGMQMLSDALDAQRNRAEDLWNAAPLAIASWVQGRDADRRVMATTHEPERRRH